MSTYHLDASALIKRYVTETGRSWIRDLFQPEKGNLSITSRLTLVKAFSAFARCWREGSVAAADCAINICAFRGDSATDYRLIDLATAVVALSQHLVEQHSPRANDAVQLATALNRAHAARVLEAEFALALFEDPYVDATDAASGFDVQEERALVSEIGHNPTVLLKSEAVDGAPLSATVELTGETTEVGEDKKFFSEIIVTDSPTSESEVSP